MIKRLFDLVWKRTPIAMVVVAAVLTGWEWTLALVFAAAVVGHELGHALLMWLKGLGVEKIGFSPISGYTLPRRAAQTWMQQGIVTLAGSAAGACQGLAMLGLYHWRPSIQAAVVIAVFALTNLINLAPIPIVDGGELWKAFLSPISRPKLRLLLVMTPLAAVLGLLIWAELYFPLMIAVGVISIWAVSSVSIRRVHVDDRLTTLTTPAEVRRGPRPLNRREGIQLAVLSLITAAVLAGLWWYATNLPGFSWRALP